MATITHEQTGVTSAPDLVLVPWNAGSEAPHVIHELLTGGVDVTLRPHQPRTGTLRLLFASQAAALACAAQHRAVGTLVLAGAEVPGGSLRYVARRVVEAQDGPAWVIEVSVQEVPA